MRSIIALLFLSALIIPSWAEGSIRISPGYNYVDQPCYTGTCTSSGKDLTGHIIYGAEMQEGVCACKTITWDTLSKFATLAAELEQRIIALERKSESP